jgi:hypothetical protein
MAKKITKVVRKYKEGGKFWITYKNEQSFEGFSERCFFSTEQRDKFIEKLDK